MIRLSFQDHFQLNQSVGIALTMETKNATRNKCTSNNPNRIINRMDTSKTLKIKCPHCREIIIMDSKDITEIVKQELIKSAEESWRK